MNKQSPAITALAICGLALAACVPGEVDNKASANYQAPVAAVATPANLRSICYEEADLQAFRARMVQQELSVGVLQCTAPDGTRKFNEKYGSFVKKFSPELSSNATELKSVVARKKVNFDVLITEIANRTAQRPSVDPAFCSRHQRALEWALVAEVTTLNQVPSPYDFGPEMKVFPCPQK